MLQAVEKRKPARQADRRKTAQYFGVGIVIKSVRLIF
jgi:hypothetical protein